MAAFRSTFAHVAGKISGFFASHGSTKQEKRFLTAKRLKGASTSSSSYQLRWAGESELDEIIRQCRDFRGILDCIVGAVTQSVVGADTTRAIDHLYATAPGATPDSTRATHRPTDDFADSIKETLFILKAIYDAGRINSLRDNNRFISVPFTKLSTAFDVRSVERTIELLTAPSFPSVCRQVLSDAKLGTIQIPLDFIDHVILDLSAIKNGKPPPTYAKRCEYHDDLQAAFPRPIRKDWGENECQLPGTYPITDGTRAGHQAQLHAPEDQILSKKEAATAHPRLQNLPAKRRISSSAWLQTEVLDRRSARPLASDHHGVPAHSASRDSTPQRRWYRRRAWGSSISSKNGKLSSSRQTSVIYPRSIRTSTTRTHEALGQTQSAVPSSDEFTFKPPAANGGTAPMRTYTAKPAVRRSLGTSITPQTSAQSGNDSIQSNESSLSQETIKSPILKDGEIDKLVSSVKLSSPTVVRDDYDAKIAELVNLSSTLLLDDRVGTELIEQKKKLEELRTEKKRKREEEAARAALAKQLALTGGLRKPSHTIVSALSEAWRVKSQSTLRASGNAVLAATGEGTELRKHDFATVVPATEWLNDEIVNGCLNWLDKAINGAAGITDVKTQTRKCFSLSSFFWKKLQGNVTGTQRMLKRSGITKDNLMRVETMLLPICESSHWTLLVIRPGKKTIAHMDSLNPRGREAYTNIAVAWMRDVLADKFAEDEWKIVRHEAPRQTNGYDCGVHTITNGMCLALGLNPLDSYRPDQMPLQRLRLASILLHGGFTGEFDLKEL